MTTVLLILLAAALIYAVIQMKAGAEWARSATVGLAVLIVLLAIVRWSCRGEPAGAPADAAEVVSSQQMSARMLAGALGKHMPKGSAAIVFALPMDEAADEAMREGLKEGFEPHQITLAAVIPPVAPDPTDPQKPQRTWQAALAKHPKASGIIIYGNAAADMEDFTPPPEKKLPVAIMAHRLTAQQAVKRVTEGSAAVIVVARPDANWPKIARMTSPRRRFEAAYLLITPDNVAEVEKDLR